jgi:xylose isomerase
LRTYLILKEKAHRWSTDKEIQGILTELSSNGNGAPKFGRYSKESASQLLAYTFNKDKILKKRLPYERLDQLTVDMLLGVR